ncbi:hypothetical protein EX30DRAFT_312144 [Ascodesmis nigricans]|uniref:Sec7-domain-containing protein n=1 Tax=Ascodesmis nigricans TaxID=341454 RepID=A0A4S2MQQ4_9PEZI|nr:hypothetical protein EX30DRAFT_312144 [Ascodesmis nigricans]
MSSLTDGRTINGKHPLGALLGRIRRDSESAWGSASRGPSPQPALPPAGSSAAVSRDIFIPERNDEDTPPAYLAKLFDAISKPMVASLLSKNGDPFHMAVLKAYMETFDFENDPMDMAVRRLLMVVELPGEAQQISRVIDAFADRYHHCNPFIYRDADEAGIISFSLIMLHTDFFNKNNKYKMQKAEYIRNTSRSIKQGGISDDILECFYANITYTPFIRVEDEYDINGEKIVPHRPRKGLFHRSVNVYDGRKLKEPIDPYPLIIDHNLDLLRCGLKDVIQFEDPYSFTGTVSRLDMAALHRAASRSGILQIVSARSRPDAFMSQATMDNPEGADPGVVEIKVTKVGILWRKDLKRKKARSPWQEWGAILTGSQLYFFRNVSWVKSLMHQYEQHQKNGGIGPVVFKPQLDEFKADVKISTDDCVALLDKSYKKHKNAFAFIRHGGVQEYFIADSEPEMNDWLHNLNYAATFRTAGVRVRGVVGGNYEGQRIRAMKRLDSVTSSASDSNSNSVQIPTGEVSVVRGNIDSNLLAEITAARREIIQQRIIESDDRIAECNRELQQHLRNGRHLSILCPIQPRVRESVMMAAATLAAKIRWVRVEMWKLQCHRNILLYDMEEERKSGIDISKRGTPIPPGSAPVASPSQVQPSLELTPTQQTISQATNDDLQRVSTTHSIPRSDRDRGRSTHSITSPRSPSTSSRTINNPSIITTTTDDLPHRSTSRRSLTPTVSESSWNPTSDLDDPIPTTSTSKQKPTKDDTPPTTKDRERSKLRRSLQRTLRATTTSDSHGHKRKHSASTMSQVPDDEDKRKDDGGAGGDGEKQQHVEGLPRKEGSFTVHGKKASVVTFGSEWQNMSNEERLMGRHRVVEDDAGRVEGEGLAVVGIGQGGGSRRGSYVAAEEMGEVREGMGEEGK